MPQAGDAQQPNLNCLRLIPSRSVGTFTTAPLVTPSKLGKRQSVSPSAIGRPGSLSLAGPRRQRVIRYTLTLCF
jgi:hypothetical protein